MIDWFCWFFFFFIGVDISSQMVLIDINPPWKLYTTCQIHTITGQ